MRSSLLLVVALAMLPAAALAAPVKKGAAPPPPPPPPANPPQVSLVLTAREPASGWTMKVVNTGLEALRIVADARLLSLDVTPPGGGTVTHCVLPAEMRPTTDTQRTLVLVAGRSYTETIDPRLYCFGERETAALVAGASVVGKLGFAQTSLSPPYVVASALDKADDKTPSPAKLIESAPLALTAPPAPVGPTPTVAPASDAVPVHLEVTMPARVDVASAFEHQTTIGVANPDVRTVSLLLRPSTVGFVVETPRGNSVRCGVTSGMTAIRELLTTLGSKAKTSLSVDIEDVCGGVFDHPGLYAVRPRVDTRRVTGSVPSYAGEAIGPPSLLRVRIGKGDDRGPPKLDPLNP